MKILKKYNQYIKGSLTEEELEDFTREIVVDYFEKEKLHNKWNRILDEGYDHSTKEQTKNNHSVAVSKRFLKIGLSSAASILLLLLSWFAYQANSYSTYEKLLTEELNRPFVESLSRKGAVEELKLQALVAYNSREYMDAEMYFEQINKIDEAEDWPFYIGLCQLYQQHPDQAIQSFSTVLKSPNGKYNIEANWYMGLAYIMKKDFIQAKKHLEFIISSSDDKMAWKVKEAKELLKALDELE